MLVNPDQLLLDLDRRDGDKKPKRGGARVGAGRPAAKRRRFLPHRARPGHVGRHPVHVTWRVVRGLPNLRRRALARAIGEAVRKNTVGQLRRGTSFRVIHFSIQPDHLHLIVEAGDARALTAGLRGLAIWMARRVNQVMGRRGRVVGDRYHARALASPREVRSAIVYVLQNHLHHQPSGQRVDENSSARWFDGWRARLEPPDAPSPVAAPRTWLAAVGWKRGGRVGLDERPRALPG